MTKYPAKVVLALSIEVPIDAPDAASALDLIMTHPHIENLTKDGTILSTTYVTSSIYDPITRKRLIGDNFEPEEDDETLEQPG